MNATQTAQSLSFEEIVRSRRAMRRFDQEANWDPEVIDKCLDLAIQAPNSSNMQLWQFIRITKAEAIQEMSRLCMGQGSAANAKEIIVFVARPDWWKKHAQFNISKIKAQESNPKKLKRALEYYEKYVPFFYNQDSMGILGFFKKILVNFMGIKKPMMREAGRTDIRISIHKSVALAAMTFMYALKGEGLDSCPWRGLIVEGSKDFFNYLLRQKST
ncbi:nitroreductase family protein [Persicobacter sp. CCB-QB2]|uniref:nitroreductase family protein n=1 Tax=Persicobacter sp. CCB-QB2 TaxID=1561025 RepID=UPI000B242A61|nr:nitroreductase family protein [Persicobacter sp. CCB-QB2]